VSKAGNEVAIMAFISDLDPEEAMAALAACRARLIYRTTQRAHLLREEELRSDRLLTVADAAKVLGVSERWVRTHSHQLGRVKIGRHVRLSEDAVQRAVKVGLGDG
jgi:excisionase family DNA binding protein